MGPGVSPKENALVSLFSATWQFTKHFRFCHCCSPKYHSKDYLKYHSTSLKSSDLSGKVCLPPELPESMTPYPSKDEYRVGQSMGINCKEAGLFPLPRGTYTCGESLTWEPPLPADLRCSDGTVDYSFFKNTGKCVTEKLQIM